ncbi:MAG: AzlD domain-containing protein [Treponema sp.]|nr:AzlD domain-containing protein [Treponema sp.]
MNNETVQLSILAAVTATLCSMLVIFLERAFPFILFSRKKPPKIISFIEKYIPPMVMAALVVYCLKGISFGPGASNMVNYLPYLAASAITVVIHLWKSNALFSILGGTITYMILLKLL